MEANSGLPKWAKQLGLAGAAFLALLSAFVTRVEFNSMEARIVHTQSIVEQILWRVGGTTAPMAPDTKPFNLPCVTEDKVKGAVLVLDQYWSQAQVIAGRTVIFNRPTMCFLPQPLVVFDPKIGPATLYGLYDAHSNSALVAVDPNDVIAFKCVIIHEMLHAIRGPGHIGFMELLSPIGCKDFA